MSSLSKTTCRPKEAAGSKVPINRVAKFGSRQSGSCLMANSLLEESYSPEGDDVDDREA